MKEKIFPNGFQSWMETFFEVVTFITLQLANDPDSGDTISERYENSGTGGMYELAEEWTDEFEEKNKEREWDGEFFDELEVFCTEKNKSI